MDTPDEWRYFRHGGILHYVVRQLLARRDRGNTALTPRSHLQDLDRPAATVEPRRPRDRRPACHDRVPRASDGDAAGAGLGFKGRHELISLRGRSRREASMTCRPTPTTPGVGGRRSGRRPVQRWAPRCGAQGPRTQPGPLRPPGPHRRRRRRRGPREGVRDLPAPMISSCSSWRSGAHIPRGRSVGLVGNGGMATPWQTRATPRLARRRSPGSGFAGPSPCSRRPICCTRQNTIAGHRGRAGVGRRFHRRRSAQASSQPQASRERSPRRSAPPGTTRVERIPVVCVDLDVVALAAFRRQRDPSRGPASGSARRRRARPARPDMTPCVVQSSVTLAPLRRISRTSTPSRCGP